MSTSESLSNFLCLLDRFGPGLATVVLLRGTASGERILLERVDAFDSVLCEGLDNLLGLAKVPDSSPF